MEKVIKNILITGGTGLIGNELAAKLVQANYQVGILTRNPNKKSKYRLFEWEPSKGTIDVESIKWAHIIIHLAGASIINKRWSSKRRSVIKSSRIQSAKLLFKTVKDTKSNLEQFISASGIGYYGAITSETIFTEDSIPHNDFIGVVCEEWEKAADLFNALNNTKVAKIRTGIVLSKKEGVFKIFIRTMKGRIGAISGSGNQYMPWISIEDLCNLYLHVINKNLEGAFNAVSSAQDTNKSFTMALRKNILKSWPRISVIGRVPSVILKLLLRDRADLLLEGSRVSNLKIISTGFKFKHNSLKELLKS